MADLATVQQLIGAALAESARSESALPLIAGDAVHARKRLSIYHEQTEQLVSYYGKLASSGIAGAPQYRKISGLGGVDEITARVFAALK